MANFKQYEPRQATAGTARLGLTDVVIVADPTDMGDIMTIADYEFVAPFEDAGGTQGGVTITKGFEETGYRLDQSDSDFETEITGHSMTVSTALGQTGDIEKFKDAWLAADATTTIVGPPTGRKKGLAARRVVPHRSLAVMEADRTGKLRAFYLREVGLAAGDSAFAVAPGALHVLPVTLRAFSDPTKADNEFGYIFEDTGFGGIA